MPKNTQPECNLYCVQCDNRDQLEAESTRLRTERKLMRRLHREQTLRTEAWKLVYERMLDCESGHPSRRRANALELARALEAARALGQEGDIAAMEADMCKNSKRFYDQIESGLESLIEEVEVLDRKTELEKWRDNLMLPWACSEYEDSSGRWHANVEVSDPGHEVMQHYDDSWGSVDQSRLMAAAPLLLDALIQVRTDWYNNGMSTGVQQQIRDAIRAALPEAAWRDVPGE